jgi:hypothetical protein
MASTADRISFFREISLLIEEMDRQGHSFMPTCFFRSTDDQVVLYNQGKSKVMHSKHQEWIAMDLVLVRNGDLIWQDDPAYEAAGAYWESLHNTWGGRWKTLHDIYHFELGD